MYERLIQFTGSKSFFLFGARGTGKTHLLKQQYESEKNWFIDLLNPETVRKYVLNPSILMNELQAFKTPPDWVIIDEVQKVPDLLDLVHKLIEETKQKFILSGSSARKLKRGGANLLAGRAFVYNLFPFTCYEQGEDFELQENLNWGSLPEVTQLTDIEDKKEYLRAYANTYIKEEILQEQIVRNLLPFQKFLQVAAQMDGRVINFSNIARDTGASTPTIQNYFQILEDTLLGFILPAYHDSVRKRQKTNPKFYFFDQGVRKALAGLLNVPVLPQTSMYGFAFEQFLINEIYRLQSYGRKDYQLSYLQTQSGSEIDLIIERPGEKKAAVEIKSTTLVTEKDLKTLDSLGSELPDTELFCFSQDPQAKKFGKILCLHWKDGLKEIGL